MQKRIFVIAVALTLGACATTAPPGVISTSAATSAPAASKTASAAAPSTPSATASKQVQSSSASASASASRTPSVSPSTAPQFDKLPDGYSYAYLTKLTEVSGRWSVALNPLTMCVYPSTDTNCTNPTDSSPSEYEITNVSATTYTVPLATDTILTVVGPSGEPTDYESVPMVEKTWPASWLIVTYSANASGEISAIKEWWRP